MVKVKSNRLAGSNPFTTYCLPASGGRNTSRLIRHRDLGIVLHSAGRAPDRAVDLRRV